MADQVNTTTMESTAPVTSEPVRPVSPTSDSDKETDNFEDAPDTASIRSLTRRKPSSTQPVSQDNQSELAAAFNKIKNKKAAKDQGVSDATKDKEVEKEVTNADETTEPAAMSPPSPTIPPVGEPAVDDGEKFSEPLGLSEPKGKRISKASTNGELNEVDLNDKEETIVPVEAQAQTPAIKNTLPPTVAADEKPAPARESPKTLSLSSITNALPAMPWSPPATESPTKALAVNPQPPIPPPITAPPPPAPASRKLTSPFAWLSRNSTKDKEAPAPPPVSPRRNTASSITTLTSNPDILGRLEEEGKNGGAAARNTLKDRFKLVRMREEAGITLPEDDKSPLATKSTTGVPSPVLNTADDKDGLAVQQTPTSPLPSSPNKSLAPGTASGVDSAIVDGQPVDWDLWQSLVYEGHAAVARTSSEELNRAIAVGIPNVIRGLVWQTLAQSKNEGLEHVYRELVARGTDKEKPNNRQSGSSVGTSSNTSNLSIQQRGETASSASSVNSDGGSSGGAAAAVDPKEAEAAAAKLLAERKKREKEEKAALAKLEKVIRKDLGMRTSFSKFAASQGLQEGLYGVCKAYALFDEAVGYAQGMNFLVMPLLFNMPEEEAFCLLVRLMNHYHLRDLFIHDMPGLHKNLYLFERLIEDLEPALYCHLHRKGISSHLYATQWFLTLFAYRFPLQLVLRIYDLILSEGLSAILKFGVVLMQKNAAALLQISDMSALTAFLRDRLFDVYIDAAPSAGGILENGFFGSSSSNIDKEVYRADQMVRDACEVKITPEMLAAYTEEWEEKTAAERQREAEITRRDAEIEELRAINTASAFKIRRLEEQLQVHDSEQAALATQLVHFKVENQELRDEAESLREQTKTLRTLLEEQPTELEKAWTEEKQGLLAKMDKVHEENRRIQQEMSEMEQQLVKTKMEYAEINSQHETLTRRWTDLKRQFA
ncbi:hypothetical protein MCOR25_002346 [Pyricularia grisea]|uniref:GTPase-activating protein GYP5 n=1 Tax=Pyricularia grisea TaxID=148305 RepID=A0A6P8AT29_PYRGI|nr:uncharacterized protein PgNI_09808 [Pyricularia grisea]KAI6378102.1 hypothetical protein MCOR25_002346 [Pyricularia grisea]TLD05252.1 hypothetical protein PgNI_09808 [Pyricularia grisea]